MQLHNAYDNYPPYITQGASLQPIMNKLSAHSLSMYTDHRLEHLNYIKHVVDELVLFMKICTCTRDEKHRDGYTQGVTLIKYPIP